MIKTSMTNEPCICHGCGSNNARIAIMAQPTKKDVPTYSFYCFECANAVRNGIIMMQCWNEEPEDEL